MSDTIAQKPRKLVNFELSPKARRTLSNLKNITGWSGKIVVQEALAELEQSGRKTLRVKQ